MEAALKIVVPLTCALLVASPAFAVQYTFTALPFGFDAVALNNAGQIAGTAPQAQSEPQPAVYANGAFTFPPFPSGNATFLSGINDAGDLLGETNDGRSPFTVFGGVVGFITAPGNTSGGIQAYGINNQRQIVGSAAVSSGQSSSTVGYVSSGSTYAVVAVPGQGATNPRAINNTGGIVGTYQPAGTFSSSSVLGFLDQGGTFTTIAVPGAAGTTPLAINDAGEIAGDYGVAGEGSRGFIDIGGVFSDITGPDGSSFLPVGLNNAGQLVGTFGGTGLSYLATPQAATTPVPEPGTAVLLGGVLGLALRRSNTRRPTIEAAA